MLKIFKRLQYNKIYLSGKVRHSLPCNLSIAIRLPQIGRKIRILQPRHEKHYSLYKDKRVTRLHCIVNLFRCC